MKDSEISEFEQRLTKFESQPANVVEHSQPVKQITKTIRMDKEEIKLIELKKNILVYFGVQKSINEVVAQRMKQDFTKVLNVYEEGVFTHGNALNAYQVGKKIDDHRPLVKTQPYEITKDFFKC